MIPSHCHEAIVVGGGPAGSFLAIALARAGRHCVVIERSSVPQDKVCGDFLSPESVLFLQNVGIDPETLGAESIHSVRIIAREVLARFPLPARALSITRRTLDEALLQRARQSGAHVLPGYTVQELSWHSRCDLTSSWRVTITDSAQNSLRIHARNVFLATGKHDLRGWRRSSKDSHNDLVALKMYFSLAPEERADLAGHVELILFPGGYAGLQPVEEGVANLCALVSRDRFQSLGSRWDRLLHLMRMHSPHLAQRLRGAQPMLGRPLALSSIPYGFTITPRSDGPSPWRLGDQAAVIPSFCGDGVAIALFTAQRAAERYLQGATAAMFHREIHCEFARRLSFATFLSRLMIKMPSLAQIVKFWPSVLSEVFAFTRVPGAEIQ